MRILRVLFNRPYPRPAVYAHNITKKDNLKHPQSIAKYVHHVKFAKTIVKCPSSFTSSSDNRVLEKGKHIQQNECM